jgi:hypothetical protein
MYRSDKKTGWLFSVGLQLLAVVLLIQLAACSGGMSKSLVVTAITPTTVPATGGIVSFTGLNFTSDTVVKFGGVSGTVYYGGPTLLTATAPANNTASAVDVVLTSPENGTVTLSKALTYKAAATTPVVSSTPTCTGTVCIYQAESPQNTLIGGAQIGSCSGCSGGLKVGWLGGSGFVSVNDIYAAADGTYNLTIYGVDGDDTYSGRSLTAAVNGGSPQSIQLVGTDNWGATAPGVTMQVQLKQGGSNSIEFGNASNYAPDLDYITISPNTTVAPAPCTNAICVYHGDSPVNTLWGSTHNGNYQTGQIAGCNACSDGTKIVGFDNGFGGVTMNDIYAPAPGTYNLTIYGVDGDGTGNYRTMSISVNGGTAQSANISGTDWNGDAIPVTIPVTLNQGNNSINISSFLYDYGPGLDYIVVSPQPQLTSIGSGPAQINYDVNTGLASFVYNDSTIISNFYSEVMLGGAPVASTSPSYTQRVISTGSNGETDVTLTATDGTPTMVQRFIMTSKNYLLVQVEMQGASLSSNSMAPIVTTQPGSITLPTANSDPRFLRVPFDNDSFRTYNASPSYNGLQMASSYEVAAFYDNTSRYGLVMGSVTHDTWKTAIVANATYGTYGLDAVSVVGGFAAPEDQLPHGAVTGSTIASPIVMVGFYDDWRNGMEQYAAVNAQFAPKLTWTKPEPMGWSSWGHVQTSIVVGTALQDATYLHTELPNFNNQGVSYLNLDANAGWSDAQAQQFISTAHGQGQKVGTYWTPWVYWGSDLTQLVEGSNYTYGEIVMRDQHGNPLKTIDGAYAIDPTHPGSLQRIDFYYLRFSTDGFDYAKFDFLSHGILEGGSNNGAFYNPTVQTGVQAYNAGMTYLAKKFGATMFIDESIAPIFPYQYANARRVSCDTFGGIGSPSTTSSSDATTSYEMNSASYGWWLAGRLYNYNDPDQMVLEGYTQYENKSRVTSAAIQGYMFDGDDLTDTAAPALAQTWLTNSSINGLGSLNLNFRPVEGNTGVGPANVLVANTGSTYYLAVFNYDGGNSATVTVDLGRAGLSGSATYKVTDLWTGAASSANGSLTVNLNPAESTIVKLQ